MVIVVSKVFCSNCEVVLVVRSRPHVVNGGGFIVTNNCTQNVVFKVDGCGILGKKDEIILRDNDGHDLLLIRKKVNISFPSMIYQKHDLYIPILFLRILSKLFIDICKVSI